MREHIETAHVNTHRDVAFNSTTHVRKLKTLKPVDEIPRPPNGCRVLEPLKLKIVLEQQRAMKTYMTGNNILDELSQDVKRKLLLENEQDNSSLANVSVDSGVETQNDEEDDNKGDERVQSIENIRSASLEKSEALENGDVFPNRSDHAIDGFSASIQFRPEGFVEFFKHYREQEILRELELLSSHPSDGIYAFPSLESLQVWHGVIFVRKGLFSEGIFHFNLILNDDFPYSRPVFRLSDNIFHPQFHSNGVLNLNSEFPCWKHGENHIWQILQFVVDSFINLQRQEPVNSEAAHLLSNDTERFEAIARNCVLDSLLIYEEQCFTKKQEEATVENPFRCRVLTGEELEHAKDGVINGYTIFGGNSSGGLVGWAKTRFSQFLLSGTFQGTDDVDSNIVDF